MTTVTAPYDATSTTSEDRFRNLRRYNLLAAAVHAAQAIAVLILSNGFALPVTASYLQGPPGTPPAKAESWLAPEAAKLALGHHHRSGACSLRRHLAARNAEQ